MPLCMPQCLRFGRSPLSGSTRTSTNATGRLYTRLRAPPAGPDLSWIDSFWAKAGSYIFCREEDGVLILPPNRVYKVNRSAAALVAFLARGGSIHAVRLPSRDAAEDTARFFGDLAALYRGEQPVNGTVSQEQYSFSFTRLPILGEIALTYRCNNACRFCYAGCGAPHGRASASRKEKAHPESATPELSNTASSHPELDTRAFMRIIDIFADEARIPFFSFTGGEPTLREDLEELIAHARARKLITNLVTNGTLIDERRATSLKSAGLGSAQVSLEAPEAELHDSLAGRPGAFKETCRGIAALLEAGIPTQTNTTITRANRDAAVCMPEFLASLGICRFSMNLFIPTIAGPVTDELFLSYEEAGPIVEAVTRQARRLDMTFFWYSPTPFCTFNPIARGYGNKSCAAADGLISVAPDGAVLPCSSWDAPLGHLLTQSFRDIWFSERAQFYKQKQFAPEACKACSSFIACQGACPLYWRYTGTLPAHRPRAADSPTARPSTCSARERL